MRLHHLASGSDGNAVIVSCGGTTLLLDAGLPYKQLSACWNMGSVDAVLITHEHGDHCRAVRELLLRGHALYCTRGTWHAMTRSAIGGKDLDRFSVQVGMVSHGTPIDIGAVSVTPFATYHDAAEPCGFIMDAPGARAVYIADSGSLPYRFDGVTHWVVECNYSEAILEASKIHEARKRRTRQHHMSLEALIEFFAAQDLGMSAEIHLIHLSKTNAHEKEFIAAIERATGVPTYAAPLAQNSAGRFALS